MNRIFYLVLLSFLVQISYAQLPNKIDGSEFLNQIHNPWNVTPESKSPESYPQKTEYFEWENGQWNLTRENSTKYNRLKLITEDIGIFYGSNEVVKMQYTYIGDKVVSKKTFIKRDYADWSLSYYDTSYYDQNWNVIFYHPYVHSIKTNDSVKYAYQYDNQNRIVEQHVEIWNFYYGDHKGTTVVEYDAQNRIIRWNNRQFFYNSKTGLMDSMDYGTWRHYFSYDPAGKLIYYEKHGSNNPSLRYSLLKYNGEGRLIERTEQWYKNGAWGDHGNVLITPLPNNGVELVSREFKNGNWVENGYLIKKYDDKNNLILYSWINPNVYGSSYSYENKYLYDEYGRILEVEKLWHRTDNTLHLSKIVYSDFLPEPVPLPETFTLYPNPASTHIRLQLDTLGAVDLQVYDMSGRLMIHNPAYEFGFIYIDQLERGAYFVRVRRGEDLFVKKFIKM